MLPVPEVILTYIYSFLTKHDVSRFNVNVQLTKHIREYMPKLNHRLLAQPRSVQPPVHVYILERS